MTLPQSVPNAAFSLGNQNGGPFRAPNGDHYAVVSNTGSALGAPGVRKADNGDNTWTAQDDAGKPTKSTANWIAAAMQGTDIHVLYATSSACWYAKFSTSSNTWTIIDESIPSSVGGTNIGIAVRSNGDPVAFYNGTQINSRGVIYYSIRSGGSWGSAVQLSDTPAVVSGTTGYSQPVAAVDSADNIYCLYGGTVVASGQDDLYYKKLDSGNSLSGETLVITTTGAQNIVVGFSVSCGSLGGLPTALFCYGYNASGITDPQTIKARFSINGGALTTELTVSSKVQRPSFSTPGMNGFYDGQKFCIVYTGTTASPSNQGYNLAWFDGAAWNSNIVMQNVGTRGLLASSLVNDAGDLKIAWLYNEGAGTAAQTVKYNEYAPPQLLSPFLFVNINEIHEPTVHIERIDDWVWMMH